eukprot:GHVU01029071.1.p1 GENE.GHVU01029071.1~~GHVU01029071.1.p1  ORF type:complete len:200 (-),score=36.47 GHVU01029071.1:209-808(-)
MDGWRANKRVVVGNSDSRTGRHSEEALERNLSSIVVYTHMHTHICLVATLLGSGHVHSLVLAIGWPMRRSVCMHTRSGRRTYATKRMLKNGAIAEKERHRDEKNTKRETEPAGGASRNEKKHECEQFQRVNGEEEEEEEEEERGQEEDLEPDEEGTPEKEKGEERRPRATFSCGGRRAWEVGGQEIFPVMGCLRQTASQ